ncbi:MAG: ester cyclase [Steroidobacteraceae bacterium]
MRLRNLLICTGLAAFGSMVLAQEPPKGVADQLALLKSSDPKLAANKKLVFDMYRTVINAGQTGEAEKFFTKEYIQHNPNVVSGRDALVAYIKQTRPAKPIPDTIQFPVIAIMAEGDLVTVATVSVMDEIDNPGKKYLNTHFDMFRIENGKIAEHWDHVEKSRAALKFDPNTTIQKK